MECLMCRRETAVDTVATVKVSDGSDVTLKAKVEEVLGHPFGLQEESSDAEEWLCDACVNLVRELYVKEVEVAAIKRGIQKICEDADSSRKSRDVLKNKNVGKISFRQSLDSQFMCRPCEATFENAEELSTHLAFHEEHKPFVCSECERCFEHEESLRVHEEKCHLVSDADADDFTEDVADCQLEEEADPITADADRVAAEQPFQCTFCDAKFSLKFFLDEHVAKHESKTKKFLCPTCDKQFRDRYHLRRHLRTHGEDGKRDEVEQFNVAKKSAAGENEPEKLPEITLICSLCEGRTFPSLTVFEEHRETEHGGEGKLVCPEPDCDKCFKYKKGLNRHMREHLGGAQYECEVCAFKSYRRDRFKEHLFTHASGSTASNGGLDASNKTSAAPKPDENAYEQCKICEKVVKARFMPIHLKNHSNAYDVSCDVCSRQFKNRKLMLAHRKRHLGVKSYVCPDCGKAFCDKSGLNSHAKTHAQVREYVCDLCGKAFLRPAHLRDHIAWHNGTKKFFCKLCDFGTITLWKLKNHERTHSGEKPFLCGTCGRGFAQKSNLDAHVRTHSGVKPYPCQLCNRAFDRKKKYEEHLCDGHGGEAPISYPTASIDTS